MAGVPGSQNGIVSNGTRIASALGLDSEAEGQQVQRFFNFLKTAEGEAVLGARKHTRELEEWAGTNSLASKEQIDEAVGRHGARFVLPPR